MPGKTYVSPEGIASFPHLAEAGEIGGRAKFSVNLLLDPEDEGLKEMKKVAIAAAREKFGKDVDLLKLRWPFSPGEEHKDRDGNIYEGYEGKMCVKFSTKNPVPVVDIKKPDTLIKPRKIYSGCIIRCAFVPFAYFQAGNRGVTFILTSVAFVKDGTPLGFGPVDPAEAFESVAGQYQQAGLDAPADTEDGEEPLPF